MRFFWGKRASKQQYLNHFSSAIDAESLCIALTLLLYYVVVEQLETEGGSIKESLFNISCCFSFDFYPTREVKRE